MSGEPAGFDLATHQGRWALIEAAPHKPTLDGRPARIGGFSTPNAQVIDKRSGASVEFSWPTVELIMLLRDGKFRS